MPHRRGPPHLAPGAGPRAAGHVGDDGPGGGRRCRVPGRTARPSRASRSSTASRGSTTTRAPGWPSGWGPTRRRPAYSGLGGSVPVRLVADAAAAMADGRLDLALVVGGRGPGHPPPPARSGLVVRAGRGAALPAHHRPAGGRQRDLPGLPDLRPARHGPAGPPGAVAGRPSPPSRPPAGPDDRGGRLPAGARLVPDGPGARPRSPRPSASNRMVATPYTKLMTAIMDVDMAAAVLLATEERADALGVPRRAAGLPARGGRRRGPGHHGGPARAVAFAGHGGGDGRSPSDRHRSTRWPTSTSTRASPARWRSPAMPSASGTTAA